MTTIIPSFDTISDRYKAAFVDLWGCMHNGVQAYPDAVAAMRKYRETGGIVVLLTNAPRPRSSVEAQISRLGIPRDAWDTIATSGDAARAAMFRGVVGNKVWFIGQEHDQVFFEPIRIVENPVPITQVPLEEAEGIVCCGPFDPHADPEVLRPQFLYAKQKGLKLLCANPDIVVDRGDSREWCAGALARLYEEMGGESLYFGKPHPQIYDLARRRLADIAQVPDDQIICIGDGIETDIKGGIAEDLDTLFVTGGLAAEEVSDDPENPDPERLEAFLARHMLSPTYAIGRLR